VAVAAPATAAGTAPEDDSSPGENEHLTTKPFIFSVPQPAAAAPEGDGILGDDHAAPAAPPPSHGENTHDTQKHFIFSAPQPSAAATAQPPPTAATALSQSRHMCRKKRQAFHAGNLSPKTSM
jgi:hypothetical protein